MPLDAKPAKSPLELYFQAVAANTQDATPMSLPSPKQSAQPQPRGLGRGLRVNPQFEEQAMSTDNANNNSDVLDLIINAEKRVDKNGNLAVYTPPKNDGGIMEVAGITLASHPEAFRRISKLPAPDRLEASKEYIGQYTAPAKEWVGMDKAKEYLMRDTFFHRGPTGSAKILQKALGYQMNGNLTPSQIQQAQKMDSKSFIDSLTKARSYYENNVVGYRANFAKGLSNRFRNAQANAQSLL